MSNLQKELNKIMREAYEGVQLIPDSKAPLWSPEYFADMAK